MDTFLDLKKTNRASRFWHVAIMVAVGAMVIEASWCPRPFNDKTWVELGFDYHANKRA